MVSTRAIVAELMRALAVLALVFLSFAAPPSLAAPGDHFAPAGYDFCGTPPVDHIHAPCHACRADPATLPPAPTVAEPAFDLLPADFCAAAVLATAPSFGRTPANPRAPPAPV